MQPPACCSKRLGATFRLNDSDSQGVERILPFDPLPRLINASEWQRLEQGLIQRLEAIDRFLADVYGEGRILADGVVPEDDVVSSHCWRPQMRGIRLRARCQLHRRARLAHCRQT
jgi:uncharacterized circularly permuted ATP-grasp superfamily protein